MAIPPVRNIAAGPDAEFIRGRGAVINPPNRFEATWSECDGEGFDPDEVVAPRTEIIADATRSIIATNDSPDVGFDASINPYRGCEHGCIYCYARPTHEYLGYSAGLDFETKILVKHDAPELLRRELASPRWVPKMLALSGVTDPYQPIERSLRITRRCLEVLAEYRNPVGIITKNRLVCRDLDVLSVLAGHQAAAVFLSITTLDDELAGALEPRASRPRARLDAIGQLAAAGVPVGVMVAPIIPGLNDHEIPRILSAAAKAGARHAGHTLVRLPLAVAPLFEDWLSRNAPDRKDKILKRIKSIRGGKLNNADFGERMKGDGPLARTIEDLFRAACLREGFNRTRPPMSTSAFRNPAGKQLGLFE